MQATAEFYEGVLGLKRLTAFEDHAGFSGVVLGPDHDADWQIEILSKGGMAASPCTCEIVLYCERAKFDEIADRVGRSAAGTLDNENPYWTQRGALTIRDPEGSVVVIVPGGWRL